MSRSPSRPSRNGHRTCELPVGLERRGKVEKLAVLRALEAKHLLRLTELDLTEPRERLLSVALSCCIERLGSLREPSGEVVHELTLCDRHALVHCLMLSAGIREITVIAECPGCHERLELTLDLSTISLPGFSSPRELLLTRKRKGHVERCRVRLPRPADLESAADESSVLVACLGLDPREASGWLKAADRFLSQSDPLGHLEIAGRCPECGRKVSSEYDLVGVWLKRIRREAEEILRDVHLLASRYHWSERDVLTLPDPRRRAYCQLCEETELAEVMA